MPVVIVLDCGATNIRAIAIGPDGKVKASHFIKNATRQDAKNPDYHVWDFATIWNNLVDCATRVIEQVGKENVLAFTVTTFGVDGAPFDANGQQIYPIISWKCPRTVPVMAQVAEELERSELYRENGVGDYSFNTMYKLRWLKEHEPEVYAQMDKFVFISSMLTHKLTGVLTTDATMAGTSMMTDLATGGWHQQALDYLGLTEQHFPPMIEAGSKVGELTAEISELFGLPASTPVFSAGHDTQFALVGSGAGENQAFLSSGTWEILMARSQSPALDKETLSQGVTVELDSVKGLYNPAIQWLSSAVVEWVVKTYYSVEKNSPDLYSVLIQEATEAGPGAGGVKFKPTFNSDADNIGHGAIEGLSIHTTRGQIARAMFEGLSAQLQQKFAYLSELCNLSDEPLLMVGGGSKNALWNQLRADALQRPIHIVKQTEATVIGAAMFAFAGVGYYPSLTEAQQKMTSDLQVVEPKSAAF